MKKHWTALIALAAVTVLAVPALVSAAGGASRKQVLIPAAGKFPLSGAVRAGDLVFVSGQLGMKPGTGELVPGGVGPETQVALDGIAAALGKAGLGMEDVVKCTVFLASIDDFGAMNEVYAKAFPKDPPARSTVAVAGLVRGAKVEIECIAVTRG
jgi:2-iminobutanoate/2-iminopropanoate deaminase